MKRCAPLLLFLFSLGSVFFSSSLSAQAPGLYINEVSQGPSGAKEWVELLVVGTPTCYTIPTMDLRGWYIDDNNGNHATGSGTGIAQGCVRFTNDPLWSAVPIGTIILIYNDADRDPALPATDDLSLSDGNCRLVIPISNCSLFEKHTTLPSTAVATYPTTGFTPCGSWTNVSMANSDDSYQTISPAGTLFHSVSWGNNTLNQIIYFAGSATGNVAYMTNSTSNNISLQANWVMVGTAASTPGAANNAANLAWICKMNNGCTAPTPISLTSTFVNASCTCTGSATVAANGGFNGCGGSYTYSWAPSGGNAATASALCAGTYTVTVSDVNGCSSTSSVTITSAASFTLSTTQTNVACNGGTNGSATVSVSGGTGPFTYAWAPSGGTGATASGLAAGTYTVSVTDATSCSGTATVTITQPTALNATQAHTNATCNGASTGTAAVTPSGGIPGYTYSWAPSGGNGSSANALAAGTYTCTITDANGCTITQSITITEPAALAVTASQVNELCNGGTNGSATVNASGGTPGYTYSWTPSGGNGSSANTLAAGTYTCTITDANGCAANQSVTITEPAALTVTASTSAATCNASNGSATVTPAGGTGTYTYAWSPAGGNAATAINLTAGSYSCTVTDANGCTATTSATVLNTGAATLSFSAAINVSCFGGNDGSSTVTATGGTAPYTYAWSPTGGNTATGANLSAGTFTVDVTDANGCITSQTVAITEPPALTISATSAAVDCFGNATGSATVTTNGGTGAYSYSWSPAGGSSATAANLAAQNYTCTVTDANGCIITQSVNITEPPQLTLSAAGFNVSCFNACDGQVAVIPSGGSPNYTFAWNTGCTNASCSNSCAGSYSVTVTDANGCTAMDSATVTEPPAIVITTTATDAHCNQPNGSAAANASGGTGNLAYQWNGGPASQNYNAISAGSYSVVVTDQNGCSDSAVVTVNNINGVNASAGNVTNLSCFNSNNGTAVVNASGGNGPYNYNWQPNVSVTDSASGIPAGNYQVTVVDADGCSSTVTLIVTQPQALIVSAAATDSSLCTGQGTQLAAAANGGTPGYAYTWNPGALNGNLQNISPAATTTFTVYATDANGCSDSTTILISVDPVPVPLFTADTVSGCAPLCVNFSDASTGPASYWNWDFGDGNTSSSQDPSHCYTNSGNYTVTLTTVTGAGCTGTIVMNNFISVFAVPSAAFVSSPQPATMINPVITFTDASSGAVSWNWNFGDVLNSYSSQQNPVFQYPDATCYPVVLTVTSANGCSDTAMQEICIDPEITLYVPNTFTPNGDGSNEYFFPLGTGIEWNTFHMLIYDRWGDLIYETYSVSEPWDGRVQGHSEIVQEDTYVWKISVTDIKGGKHNLMGHVNVIK